MYVSMHVPTLVCASLEDLHSTMVGEGPRDVDGNFHLNTPLALAFPTFYKLVI